MKKQGEGMQDPISPTTWTAEEVGKMLRPRPVDAHKGTMGHALLVAGSKGMAGAAILASQACLRSGIGKLTLHTPEANRVILQCAVPEAILHTDRHEGILTEHLDTKSYQAVGIGPGIGTSPGTALALRHYLQGCTSPLVLDADALNLIAQDPALEALIPYYSILTPHVGEFHRLTHPCESAQERLQTALTYAQSHQVYVVLKGHPSIVCTPMGDALACPYGNSGMATPGSGDVLTGIITGLLAQGYPTLAAAILGTWLHALAGDCAAEELGEEAMLASDIVKHLHEAYKRLKAGSASSLS